MRSRRLPITSRNTNRATSSATKKPSVAYAKTPSCAELRLGTLMLTMSTAKMNGSRGTNKSRRNRQTRQWSRPAQGIGQKERHGRPTGDHQDHDSTCRYDR